MTTEPKTAEEQGIVLFLNLHGPARPGDLEDNFCGKPDLYSQIAHPLEAWRLSPYIYALTTLIDRGLVRWWRDDRETVWYSLNEPKP